MRYTLYPAALVASVLSLDVAVAQYTATYDPSNLPPTTEQDQHGTNKCGTANNQTSLCQNVYVNSVKDFCVWGPPDPNGEIGTVEQIVVAYCSEPGRGTRLFLDGTLQAVHFIETPDYIQVTGTGDFTKMNIVAGDAGGELDPHGPDGFGNPHGGLVFSNVWSGGQGLGQQIHEWTNFQAADQFCIRTCKPGGRDVDWCQHVYDVMGCAWNMPGDYGPGFTSCKGDSGIPMGLYPQPDGSTSTFHQGDGATPAAQNPPASSSCTTYQSTQLYAATAFASSSTITSAPHPTSTSTRTGTAANQSATSTTTPSAALRSVTFGFGPLACLTAVVGAILGSLVVLA